MQKIQVKSYISTTEECSFLERSFISTIHELETFTISWSFIVNHSFNRAPGNFQNSIDCSNLVSQFEAL